VGLEMTLEGAQSRIWCSKLGWQTVPCSCMSLCQRRTFSAFLRQEHIYA